jgi:prepilin-type processing-associated H-X9-DG protein
VGLVTTGFPQFRQMLGTTGSISTAVHSDYAGNGGRTGASRWPGAARGSYGYTAWTGSKLGCDLTYAGIISWPEMGNVREVDFYIGESAGGGAKRNRLHELAVALDQVVDGMFFCFSAVTVSSVKDGTSNTALVGEKYLDPGGYFNSSRQGDMDCAWVGNSWENCRRTATGSPAAFFQPKKDGTLPASTSKLLISAGTTYDGPMTSEFQGRIWGSPHGDGFTLGFCDGSVHFISYGANSHVLNSMMSRMSTSKNNENWYEAVPGSFMGIVDWTQVEMQ